MTLKWKERTRSFNEPASWGSNEGDFIIAKLFEEGGTLFMLTQGQKIIKHCESGQEAIALANQVWDAKQVAEGMV